MTTLTQDERQTKSGKFARELVNYLTEQKIPAGVETRQIGGTAKYGVKITYSDHELQHIQTFWFEEKTSRHRYQPLGLFYIRLGDPAVLVHEKQGEFQNEKFLVEFTSMITLLKNRRKVQENRKEGLARALAATGGDHYKQVGLFRADPLESGNVRVEASIDADLYKKLEPILMVIGMNCEGEFYDEMFENIILSTVKAWLLSGTSDMQDVVDTLFQDTVPEMKAIVNGGHYD